MRYRCHCGISVVVVSIDRCIDEPCVCSVGWSVILLLVGDCEVGKVEEVTAATAVVFALILTTGPVEHDISENSEYQNIKQLFETL